MKIQKNKINFKDKRGFILDVIYKKKFNHATLIYTKRGAVRGNHYHKKTTQISFLINGSCHYYYRNFLLRKLKKIKLNKFDYVITKPQEVHSFKFLKNSLMMVFSKGLRGGKDYENDTFRIKKTIKI